MQFIGRTRDYAVTQVSEARPVTGPQTVALGDEIEGVRIGAIQCSFHWRDASYGGQQYMWRGRWACKAGRSREEVEKAVEEDGTKRFDYIHVAPVSLPSE
jgi:hypothetical protein